MYINEVIRRVDRLYPNEYTKEEKYDWCDELSAMLCQEYIRRYDKVTLKADLDGTYLLPEGVTFEMIDKVRAKGNVIQKLDFRSFGIEPMYGRHRQFYIPSRCGGGDEIEVVYLRRHMPIRGEMKMEGYITFNDKGFYFGDEDIKAGDIVNIHVNDKDINYVLIVSVTKTDEETEENGKFYANVGDAFGSYHFIGDETVPGSKIERVVMDQTVCDAPYDQMYVDYVLAQIFYYQRNYPSYNQHINLFNQRLEAYERWLQKRRVQEKDNKIYNWW